MAEEKEKAGLAEDATESDVRWPQNAVDAEGDDLVEPIATLLRKLALLETKEDVKKGVRPLRGTPHSLQVITAGATEASKVAGIAASSAAVTGAIASAWSAYLATELALKIALVAAAGVIVAAGVIAIAIIVRSDVGARADATVAEYRARAVISAEFLRQAAGNVVSEVAPGTSAALLHALAAFPDRLTVEAPDGGEQRVTGVALRSEGLQVRLASGDWIKIGDVTGFTATKA